MHGKWTWEPERSVWQACIRLPDGSLSEVFAEVHQTRLGWAWQRWPTQHVPYAKGCTMVGIEATREEAMRVAIADTLG